MRFTLSVKMDNAAFEDSSELPRILRELAKKIEREPEVGNYNVQDMNGNTVGHGRYVGKCRP